MRGRPTKHDKNAILEGAVKLARDFGYLNVTYARLAEHCNCNDGTIVKHFPTMKQLRRAIMSAAVARRDHRIIAQGLAANDSKAKAAPAELKRAAVEGLL